MIYKTEFTETPDIVVIQKRPDANICDMWVRKNIEEIEREGDIVITADEAYMNMDVEDCPNVEEVESNVDEWFELAGEWMEPIEMSNAQLQAKIEYLEILVKGVR